MYTMLDNNSISLKVEESHSKTSIINEAIKLDSLFQNYLNNPLHLAV
jgi:hypothetical protein